MLNSTAGGALYLTAVGMGPSDSNISLALALGARRIAVPNCTRVESTATRLVCNVPAGAGAHFIPMLTVNGATSSQPFVSFPSPVITSASDVVENATGLWFTLDGSSFGADVTTLDFVQYARLDGMCGLRGRPAPCDNFSARGCVIVRPHMQIACRLDTSAASYGTGFSVQVSVAGQVSPWFGAVLEYPAPAVTAADLVVTASTPLQPTPTASALASTAVTYAAQTAGGSLVRVTGSGFVFGKGMSVSIGGVVVDANISAPTAVGAAGAGGRATMAQSFFVTLPPGFGNVTVNVAVGTRSAIGFIVYQPPLIQLLQNLADAGGGYNTFTVSGVGLSACAILLSTPGCAIPDAYAAGVARNATLSAAAIAPSFAATIDGKDITTSARAIAGFDTALTLITDVTRDGKPPLNISIAGAWAAFPFDYKSLANKAPTFPTTSVNVAQYVPT